MFYLTATEMLKLLRAGQVSAVEVLEAHLRRIEEVNPRGQRDRHAGGRARARGGAGGRRGTWRAGDWRGPLHGLPVAHKDLADTAGIRTTYGSPLFADHVPGSDALIVRRMRRGRGDHARQDQHARVRHRLAHRQRGVRRDPQPVRPVEVGGRQQRRGRGGAGDRDGGRWPTAPTWAARCATRPRSATWSGCGRRRAGCRRRRRRGVVHPRRVRGRWPAPSRTWRC